MSRKTHQTARGYTIIEIMMAVLISASGFAVIFSMQLGTLQGNISAREMSVAVNLAERYIESLRAESYRWTEPQPPEPLLNQVGWRTLTENPVDQNGRAHVDNDPNGTPLARQRFCVHYWVRPLEGSYTGMLNTRVRVIWPVDTQDQTGLAQVCSRGGAEAWVPNVRTWRSITIPTTLRRHAG